MPRRRHSRRRARAGHERTHRHARSRQGVRSGDLEHRTARRARVSDGIQSPARARLERTVSTVILKPGDVRLAQWRAIYEGADAALDRSCESRIAASAAAIARIIAKDQPIYGINTGF